MRKWCLLSGVLACTGCAATATVETVSQAGLLVYRTTVMHTGSAPSSWAEARFAVDEPYLVTVELTELGALCPTLEAREVWLGWFTSCDMLASGV